MGKHTPSGSRRQLMEKDSTSNRLQAGNFAALSPDSTVSLPVKEFIQSLLSKTIHVNTLLMFSSHERRVFMCVCVCITDWLALKKKNQMSCLSRQLFDAFERLKYVFQTVQKCLWCPKMLFWPLLMFKETHFHQYSDLWSTKMGFYTFKTCFGLTRLNDLVKLNNSLGF